jgi:hypothetical protein
VVKCVTGNGAARENTQHPHLVQYCDLHRTVVSLVGFPCQLEQQYRPSVRLVPSSWVSHCGKNIGSGAEKDSWG